LPPSFAVPEAWPARPGAPLAVGAVPFGVSSAESAAFEKGLPGRCMMSGDFDDPRGCIVLLGRGRWGLEQVVVIGADEARSLAALEKRWGAPLKDASGPLWLDEPSRMKVRLEHDGPRPRLVVERYAPARSTLGSHTVLFGFELPSRPLLGATRAEIRNTYPTLADCKDSGLCSIVLPGTERDLSTLTIHLETRPDARVERLLFTIRHGGDDAWITELLSMLSAKWGTATPGQGGVTKTTFRFARTRHRVEVTGLSLHACMGTGCP
jgi:hypothetical protein